MFDKPVDLNSTYNVKRVHKSKLPLAPEPIKKFKPYKGKKVQATKHNRGITEKQAKYIVDMRLAREMRQWL